MTRKTYFVTGTDTGVGKSVVTAAILEAANRRGLRTLAMKPIASGSEQTADGLRNEDALLLRKHMSETLDYDQINPVAMAPAIAPHVAARQAERSLSVQRLTGLCRGLQTRPGDLLLIEGAGGWRVPLNEQETFAQVPGALGVPVILVVSLKLGCINHALLTAEAILRDGLTLAGWVANRTEEAPMAVESDNLAYLRAHLPAPCLGELPWSPDVSPAALGDHLDVLPLIEN